MNEQKHLKYNIVLNTTIGNKIGKMYAKIIDDTLECVIIVMKNENYFSGTIDSYGKFKIYGHLKTLTNNIDCNGEGYLDDSSITFKLNAEGRNLIVTGTSVVQGDDIYEKII